MKRILLTLTFVWAFVSTYALSYERASQEALFLTDKMAYELDLTPDQYDRAYQINLDYLLSINTVHDIDGYYWQYRNADMRYILHSWQYNLYVTLDYFYRPIRWVRSAWYFPVFDYYRRGYYYFSRPTVFSRYRGVSWAHRRPADRSPYYGWRPPRTGGRGMRSDYRGHDHGRSHSGRAHGGNSRDYGRSTGKYTNPGMTTRPETGSGIGHDRGRTTGATTGRPATTSPSGTHSDNQGRSFGRPSGSSSSSRSTSAGRGRSSNSGGVSAPTRGSSSSNTGSGNSNTGSRRTFGR